MQFDARVDPDTGEIITSPQKPGDPPNPLTAMVPQMTGTMAQMFPDSAPTSLRKFAGDLVLAAHARRSAGR